MDVVTGVECLDGLVAKVGGLNGLISGADAVDSAAYLALVLGMYDDATVLVSRAKPRFSTSEPLAASPGLLVQLGLADLDALKDACAEPGFVHVDDAHMMDQHCTSQCTGEFKVRFRKVIAAPPATVYEAFFVSLFHFRLSGVEVRISLILPE